MKARRFITKGMTVGENPSFLRLVQVARDDVQFGARLRQLLILPKIDRIQQLDQMIDAMLKDHVPKDIVSAAKSLMNDAVATKVRNIIENSN